MKEKFYKSSLTIKDEKGYTIVEGEECLLDHILINNDKAFAILTNTSYNTFKIPINLFKYCFTEV